MTYAARGAAMLKTASRERVENRTAIFISNLKIEPMQILEWLI